MKFFITVRSISGNAFGNNIGAIRYLAVPDGAAPAPAHAIGLKAWLNQVMATFGRDQNGAATGNVLFFVHGFNVGIADVDAQHDNVRAGLAGKLACTIVSFEWPSWTDTFAYLAELDTAKQTAISLVNSETAAGRADERLPRCGPRPLSFDGRLCAARGVGPRR